MKIKCEYCGADMNDYDERCNSCGAQNRHLLKRKNGVPSTIEELEIWYKDQNFMPSNGLLFIFGKDYRGPNAYGIYKDVQTEKYVVYESSQSMKRKVLYEGNDEAYAVSELYMKIREEIILNKSYKDRASKIVTEEDIPEELLNKIKSHPKLIRAAIIIGIIIVVLSIIF